MNLLFPKSFQMPGTAYVIPHGLVSRVGQHFDLQSPPGLGTLVIIQLYVQVLANVNEHLLCTHSIFTIIITLMDKEAETKGRKATCPRPHRKSSSSRLTPELKVLTTTLPFSHSPFEIWRQLTSVPIMEVYPPRKEFLILFSRKGSSHCYLDRVK